MVSQEVGYDAGKQIKGRKRFMTVDTLGLILRVLVTAANVPERSGGKQVIKMSCCPTGRTFSTKARFHKHYLQEYLGQFGLFYSKKNPKVVADKKYLDALKKRCESMNHLSSLKLLLDIWDSIETL